MRSRLTATLLGAILALGLAACSKKEQPAQAPAADQSTQQAPAITAYRFPTELGSQRKYPAL
jgi:uncharacterized lipoprotein